MGPATLLLATVLLACGDKDTADTRPGGDGGTGDGGTGDGGTGDGGTGDGGSTEDADGDGYDSTEDCDDSDPSIFPGAPEICGDAIDNDCNYLVDPIESVIPLFGGSVVYRDGDGDGFGWHNTWIWTCADGLDGYVGNDQDCDDDNELVPLELDPRDLDSAFSGNPGVGCFKLPAGEIEIGDPLEIDRPLWLFGASGDTPTELSVNAYDTVIRISGVNDGQVRLGDMTIVPRAGVYSWESVETTSETDPDCPGVCVVSTERYAGGAVFVYDSSDVVLDGLRIEGGRLITSWEDSGSSGDETWGFHLYSIGGGLFLERSSASIVNSIFADNQSTYGSAVYVDEFSELIANNSIFFGNQVELDSGDIHIDGYFESRQLTGVGRDPLLYLVPNATASITHSILYGVGDSPPLDGDEGDEGFLASSSYNDLYSSGVHSPYGSGWTGGHNDIEADPLFVAYDAESFDDSDLHLQDDSPAIDAGEDLGLDYLDTDGTPPDLGAYGGADGDW